MEKGEAVLLGGVLIGGVLLISRLSSSSSLPPGANTGGAGAPVGLTGGFTSTGPVVPGLAPAFAVLKPIADRVTTPAINAINSGIGGTDIYGPGTKPVANADGTYTNVQGGAEITYNKDGTITRHTLPFAKRHPTIAHTADTVVSTGKSAIHTITLGLL
jgi:hypothetical protein